MLLALAGACAPAPSAGSDQLVLVGAVRTLDPAAPRASALLISGGWIAEVGGPELAEHARRSGGAVVDLGSAVVAPALVDHHVHLFNVGLAELNAAGDQRLFLDLAGTRSLDEIARRVAERAARTAPGAWVLGAGWSQAAWGTQQLPTHHVLTDAAPDHPVLLSRVDGHAGWANRRALELGGWWVRGPDPAGGAVPRDAAGRPTGVLLERANEPVVLRLPELSDADVAAAFRLGAVALAARGVTRAYDAGVLPSPGLVALDADLARYLRLLVAADSARPLPLDLHLMLPAPSRLADSLLAAPPADWQLSPRVRITHLKLFADGALGSRGAALSHPYADDRSTSGVLRMTSAEIAALARRALDAGLGVATHAIGDRAVTEALDAYEAVVAERPDLPRRRLRIEHFSYASERDLRRAAALGVVLSIQSNFNALPDEHPTFGAMRVGARGDDRVYAWATLARLGAVLAEGSDYFTRPGGALDNVIATLTRKGTVGAARDDSAGRVVAWGMNATWLDAEGTPSGPALRGGAPADLVVLDRDPFVVPRDSLGSIRVLATLRRGRPTYVAEGFTALGDRPIP